MINRMNRVNGRLEEDTSPLASAVRYDADQVRSEEEKAQARANMGAISAAQLADTKADLEEQIENISGISDPEAVSQMVEDVAKHETDISALKSSLLQTHITIKTDGTGDYTNPIDAVRNITDSSKDNQYVLDIYPGTYHLETFITSAEQQGSTWGLKLPNYVHMYGVGTKDEIIIDCTLPDDSDTYAVEYTSTLNINQNNNLENITFTGQNVRYVVHDESSNTYQDWRKNVKNCDFIHNGNAEGFWTSTDAWGEGSSSGSYSYFENCVFKNKSYVQPFSFHTNTNYSKPCTHVFHNCSFIQEYIGNDTAGSFAIKDLQCGQPINVEFVGCIFSRFIEVENFASTVDIAELNITGHGNNLVFLSVYRPNVTNPKKLFTKFSDEVMIVNNPWTLVNAGRPLRWANFARNDVGIVQSNGLQCIGVALDDIPAGGTGYMQFSGVVNLYGLGITNISNGALVGVKSYTISEVTDNSYFARAVQNNVIKFI